MNVLKWVRFGRADAQGPGLPEPQIFEVLSRRERRRVERSMRVLTLPAGTHVFNRGEVDDRMYVVLEGGVEIRREPSEVPEQGRVMVGPGDFFGEMALVDHAPRSASAVSNCHTRLLCLSRAEFVALSERHPRIGIKMIFHLSQVVAERLRRTNRLLKEAGERRSGGADAKGRAEVLQQGAGGEP